MKWQVKDTPGSSDPDHVAVDLYTRYAVDDDGTFETPDDLDPGTRRRLEEAGHKPIGSGDDGDDGDEASDDDDVEDAVDELEEDEEEEPDDEYSDMDRSALYEEYKDRGGPKSWNETTAESLREALRINDEHGTFPTDGDS